MNSKTSFILKGNYKMNNYHIVCVLESCLLTRDGVSKKDLIEFGIDKELVEMGINLYSFLREKEITDKFNEVKNG